MKKLIYTAGAALVMLASVSCKKNETVKEAQPSVEKAEMVFTATSESGALKTTIESDGVTAVWSSTDNLKVFTAADQTGSVCNYKSGAGTNTAEFAGQCAKKGPWTAICPSSAATGFNNGTITLTMPATQTYAENTFASGAMPCVAYSETNTFNFKHSFGVLKLSLKLKSGKTGSVKSITVTTKGSEKLNGTFAVNPQTSAVATKSGSDGSKSITLNCTSVALSTSTATDFWIVVPQGAFANGFDVTVTSTDDIETALSTTKANTITAGEVNKMPVQIIEFVVPTTGYAAVNHSAGIFGDKVKWIQLWENGPKWAEFNVGATSVSVEEYEECGGHYCWGMTIDQCEDNDEEYYDGEEDIQGGSHDTAKNLWGSNWQMPTKADYDALLANCDVQWQSEHESGYGVAGRLYTGKGDYAGNSVFFPATGLFQNGKLDSAGDSGPYWCSTPDGSYFCKILGITQTSQTLAMISKVRGCSVRAVLKE